MSKRRSRDGQSTAVTSVIATNWQRGSSRRNVATFTISAALAEIASSPTATRWPLTASGSAAVIRAPSSSSFVSMSMLAGAVWSSPLDRPGPADLLLQQHHAVQQRLGGGRAARHVDVDRHDAVAAPDDG